MEIVLNKEKMKDEKGRYIVQGLFLEDRYNTDLAMFTFDGSHKEYKGKTYYSLKKLYLDLMDPVEYIFATEYLVDWPHWQRLCNNAIIGRHVEQWREELSLKLASEGAMQMVNLALEKESYQATKWLSDRGWDVKEKGRPSKSQIDEAIKKKADEMSEWDEDHQRILEFKGKK